MTGIFIFGATATIQAQHPSTSQRFKQWDKDKNQKLTHAEFYEGMKAAGVFEAWDRNGDRLLDRQEVYAGRARMQQLAEKDPGSKEAAEGPKSWPASRPVQEGGLSFFSHPGAEAGFSFKEVDLNRDGTLDKTEFFTALFRLWDQEKNGFLRSNELEEGRLKKWMLE